MIYLGLGVVFALGLIWPKKKVVVVVDALVLGLLIGLRGGNSTDYYNYLVEYNKAQSIPVSMADFPGYNLLMRVSQNLGINFTQFVFLIAFLSVILMIVGMSKLNKYVPFALSLFLIYPFGHEAAQMRTFLADAIVCVALSFLLARNSKKSKYNYLIFFIFTFFAAEIHTLAWFYFGAGLIYILLRNRKHNTFIMFLGVVVLLVLIRGGILNPIIQSQLTTDKLDHWLNNSTGLGVVLYTAITLLIYGMIQLILMQLEYIDGNQVKIGIYENIRIFSNSILLLIPFFTKDITYDRLWRIFLIILYLYSGEFLYSKKIKKYKIIILICLVTLLTSICIMENELTITKSILMR